jgi:hypothetical protein
MHYINPSQPMVKVTVENNTVQACDDPSSVGNSRSWALQPCYTDILKLDRTKLHIEHTNVRLTCLDPDIGNKTNRQKVSKKFS